MPKAHRGLTRRERDRLRAHAIEMFEQGVPEDEVTRRTDASPQAVSDWHARWLHERHMHRTLQSTSQRQGWFWALVPRWLLKREGEFTVLDRVVLIITALGLLFGATKGTVSLIDRLLAKHQPASYRVLASTTDELLAISDDGRVDKVANFGSSPPERLAWSRDGRAVAWVVKASANAVYGTRSQARVVRVDGRMITNYQPEGPSGAINVLDVVAGGSGFVVQTGEGLVHLPDNGRGDPQPLSFDLQTLSQDYSPEDLRQSRLLAGSEQRVWVAVPSRVASAYGGPSDIIELPLDAGPRLLANDGTDRNLGVRFAAVDHHEQMLAYTSGVRVGLCMNRVDSVSLIDLRTRDQRRIPLPDAGDNWFWDMTSISFGLDGRLTVTLLRIPASCTDEARGHLESFVQDGDHFRPLTVPESTVAATTIFNDQVLTLVAPVAIEDGFFTSPLASQGGRLILPEDRPIQAARNVRSFLLRPG
jgi:hypothetical protein